MNDGGEDARSAAKAAGRRMRSRVWVYNLTTKAMLAEFESQKRILDAHFFKGRVYTMLLKRKVGVDKIIIMQAWSLQGVEEGQPITTKLRDFDAMAVLGSNLIKLQNYYGDCEIIDLNNFDKDSGKKDLDTENKGKVKNDSSIVSPLSVMLIPHYTQLDTKFRRLTPHWLVGVQHRYVRVYNLKTWSLVCEFCMDSWVSTFDAFFEESGSGGGDKNLVIFLSTIDTEITFLRLFVGGW